MPIHRSGIFLIIGCILILLTCSGCFLVPVIDSFREAGMTEGGRQSTLQKALKDYHLALFWGQIGSALQLAVPEEREKLRRRFDALQDRERIVESKVRFVDYQDSAYKANVEVMLKIHNLATNIVGQRLEKEAWVFSLSQGWQIASSEAVVS
jgi:hypothetical protein